MGVTLKELEKRLEKEPDNLPLRVTVAGMMSDAGRKADAVEHYRRVALAYRAQGRSQQALMVARNILELAPGDAAIRTLVAELTEVKTPAPTPTPPPAAPAPRPQSAAEPTKTGVRGMPEPRPASAMPVAQPPPSTARRRSVEDDIETQPSASATGSGALKSITNVGIRPVTTKGPKSTPPVVRIPDKKGDSQPPSATFRSQPPPPPSPRHSPFPDDFTDPNEPPRRSSFEVPTPLPQPMPYHLADPTASQDRISREGLSGLEKLDEQRDGTDSTPTGGGLAEAARRISSLIKPRSEKPTRNPFMPDPTLRPDAPPLPAPARTAKPAVDPYADKPIVPRADKPTRQPLIRSDKPTQNPPIAAEGRAIAKLPSVVRPVEPEPPRPKPPTAGPEPSRVPLRPEPAPVIPPRAPPVTSTSKTQPRPIQPPPAPALPTPDPDDGADETRPTAPRPAQTRLGDTFRAQPPPAGPAPMLPVARPPLRPSDKGPETMKAQPPPAARPRPMVPQPARDPGSSGMRAAVPRPATDPGSSGARAPHDSGATRVLGPSRPVRDTNEAEIRKTTRLPSSPGELRASRDAATLPPAPTRTRAPSAGGTSRLPRDTNSPETRVDNLPPAPEPGADHLPPPPAAPPRAVTAIPRTPSYSDEVVAELDTRQRPRLSSAQLDKIEAPPPTVPTEQVELDDEVTPPPSRWERRPRTGAPPIRDTPMDPQTDVHTSVARDTNIDMTEAGTDVGSIASGRDTRRDAAAEPPEDDTAPRELVGPTPLANAFFLAIPPNKRDAALTRCIKRIVRPGQTVIRQGETSHPLYLVVSGQLVLQVERANGTLAKIDEIDAGQYIGEGSLLARTPAIAHVVASAASELLALPPHALFELAGAYPALWAALKESAERRARAYEKLLRG